MEPKYGHRNDGTININYNRYKREIKGLEKSYWQVVYELGSEEEVSKWDIDKFLEAYAALQVINEDANKEFKKGGGK